MFGCLFNFLHGLSARDGFGEDKFNMIPLFIYLGRVVSAFSGAKVFNTVSRLRTDRN